MNKSFLAKMYITENRVFVRVLGGGGQHFREGGDTIQGGGKPFLKGRRGARPFFRWEGGGARSTSKNPYQNLQMSYFTA